MKYHNLTFLIAFFTTILFGQESDFPYQLKKSDYVLVPIGISSKLFANYLDFTRMRVKLSFDLWGTLGSTNPTAILPESENVCLYLNGEFQGLYLLAERPDRKLFDLDSSLNGNNSSLIFQSKGETTFNKYIKNKWEQDWPNIEDINIIDENILSISNKEDLLLV